VFEIENVTRTRVAIADQRIHLLGSYANLRVVRNAICDLIIASTTIFQSEANELEIRSAHLF
jgi:rRNA processing protein Krr1/Pno1